MTPRTRNKRIDTFLIKPWARTSVVEHEKVGLPFSLYFCVECRGVCTCVGLICTAVCLGVHMCIRVYGGQMMTLVVFPTLPTLFTELSGSVPVLLYPGLASLPSLANFPQSFVL